MTIHNNELYGNNARKYHQNTVPFYRYCIIRILYRFTYTVLYNMIIHNNNLYGNNARNLSLTVPLKYCTVALVPIPHLTISFLEVSICK